jgi:putative transposase
MALAQRQPDEVIHHSDHGCRYTSLAFRKQCREMGVKPSVGSVGDAYDFAMAESFFATLECELLDRRFRTQTETRHAIFRFIEGWYNPHRHHSALGNRSRMTYERIMQPSRKRLDSQPISVHRNGSTPVKCNVVLGTVRGEPI